MPFIAAGPPPDRRPPLVELTYFTVREACAAAEAALPGEDVVAIDGPLWQLTVPFAYRRGRDGTRVDVPAHKGNVAVFGNHTDLATVPGFLWGILAPYGNQMRPALMHDRLCDEAHTTWQCGSSSDDRTERAQLRRDALGQRKRADCLFRDALRDEGAGWARRVIFWAGVSFGRFLGYQKLRGSLLAVAVAAVAVLVLRVVARSAHLTMWNANRWLFAWPVLVTVLVLMFLVVQVAFGRWALAVVPPLTGLLVAVVAAGTGPQDHGRWHSWHVTLVLLACSVGLAGLAGLITDPRVAMIGIGLGPILVPVIVVTVNAELLLALPDVRSDERGGLGPIMPTILPTSMRWRLR